MIDPCPSRPPTARERLPLLAWLGIWAAAGIRPGEVERFADDVLWHRDRMDAVDAKVHAIASDPVGALERGVDFRALLREAVDVHSSATGDYSRDVVRRLARRSAYRTVILLATDINLEF